MHALEGLTKKAQAEIADSFFESANTNAELSDGLLVAYEPDFVRFPYQSLSLRRDRREVSGNPLPPKEAFNILELIDNRCKGLEQSFGKADETNGAISAMGEVIESGQNFVGGTDHVFLVDIAYFGVGNSAVLRERGIKHKSSIVLSKAISDYCGVNLRNFKWKIKDVREYIKSLGLTPLDDDTVPVREFLKLGFDTQHLVIPSTASFEGIRGVQSEAIELHNDAVKKSISTSMHDISDTPTGLYVALPGTKTRQLDISEYILNVSMPGYYQTIPEIFPDDLCHDINIMGRISSAVTEYTAHALTFASVIRLYGDNKPIVSVNPSFEALNAPDKVLNVARKLIELIDEVDETKTVYDVNGTLKVL